jgi:hypothetical protein
MAVRSNEFSLSHHSDRIWDIGQLFSGARGHPRNHPSRPWRVWRAMARMTYSAHLCARNRLLAVYIERMANQTISITAHFTLALGKGTFRE